MNVIELAKQAGLNHGTCEFYGEELKAFAELVRADEREACAKLLESRKTGANELMDAVRDMEARAIRARGTA
jgi:hypothetical protein